MALDTSGRFRNDSVYIAWNDNANGDPDILFTSSTDGGARWNTPIRVNDDPIRNGIDQFFPWLSVDPNGQVNIIWFDRRLDPTNNLLIDVFHSDSQNGGAAWQTNGRVTSVSHPPVLNVDQNVAACYMGDYNGSTSDAQHIYAAWGDNRRGNPDTFFAILHNTQDIRVQGALEFGSVPVKPAGNEIGFKDVEFEVLNVGDLNLTVNSVTCVAGRCGDFSVLPNPTTPLSVSPDAHVSFVVRFNPTATGARTATIRVSTNDPDQPTINIPANGTGTSQEDDD
jgi:hypothetical protein